ncbi:MAG: 50S ribosomal protein L23 [Candidatus Sungbacteria bacterium]|nr:50S ribosomal protein L23 [Candidatus Sungbacteria bacterium]
MFNPFKGKQFKKEDRPRKKEIKSSVPEKASGKPAASYPLGVLVAPRITEKATQMAGGGKYVFEVQDTANAFAIRNAVEKKYGVSVEKVNVITQRGRTVRLGRQAGWRKGFKKAIVTLASGQSIEIT